MAEPPSPLNYHGPDPLLPPPNPMVPAGWMVLGVICGLILTTIAGFLVAGTSGRPEFEPPPPPRPVIPPHYWPGVIVFAVATIGGLYGCVYLLRQPQRRMFLVGLLLGTALMSMLEGLCFYNT